jgi:hypothetical protein
LALLAATAALAAPAAAPAATICLTGDCPTTTPQLQVTFAPALDTTIAIPGGTGTLTAFPAAPAISNGVIAFTGAGTGQMGIYAWPPSPVFPPAAIRVADEATTIPGGTGTFSFAARPLGIGMALGLYDTAFAALAGLYAIESDRFFLSEPVGRFEEHPREAGAGMADREGHRE